MSRELNKESDCRLVYAEIVRGYSSDPSGNFFVKHFNELDAASTEQLRRKYFQEAEQIGLLTVADKLKFLQQYDQWTAEDEAQYKAHQEAIQGLEISLKKLVIPAQIADMQARLAEKRKENLDKWMTRAQLLGATKEEYANRKAAEYHIISAFYQDAELLHPAVPLHEMDDLSYEDLNLFMHIYQETHEVFTEKNIKRIAVCPFFLNAYLTCNENAYFFFGRHVALLTIYQLSLFGKGGYYKMLLDECEHRPPEEYYDDLSSVVQFWDRQYSIILGKRTAKR